ncbi:isochorismatase family protein [Halobacteria archaeon AArc-m2/3/4]|uniref:Isochorismatase family protein n=1 Tax=Natronoglomus mannanivorans TaxID=2979990 RepID=A0AAP2Z209_9EURY|nr:isochorismatase family protein [Halobacteria archaeon AArc-xg1-1]MCU4973831.1 isochorismatase family protein [Halobacteria archaeon AArc-m2/3/4]
MGETIRENHFVPDYVSDTDLEYFAKSGTDKRTGWGDNPALLIVDMTEAFVDGEYITGRSDTGQAAVEANERLLTTARETGVPVFYTTPISDGTLPDEYRTTSSEETELSEERRRIYSSAGNAIAAPIAPAEDEVVIEKPAPSSFFDTHLSNLLHYYDIDTLIVTGMTTSGCVRATVVDGKSSNFRIVVPVECVADRSISSHNMSLFDMDMKYADVTPLEDVLETLEAMEPMPAD